MSLEPGSGSSKVATSIVESLKGQPLILALVLFNLAFVIVVYLAGKDTREHQAQTLRVLIDNQTKMQELLARCTSRTDVHTNPTTGGT